LVGVTSGYDIAASRAPQRKNAGRRKIFSNDC
jgi:hypothetical protein